MRYDFNFAWDTPYGHVVRLLDDLDLPGSIVVDLGCGFGAIAGEIVKRGASYLGVDIDNAGFATIQNGGGETLAFDLSDRAGMPGAVSDAVAGRRISAITALDILEHLVDSHGFLTAIRSIADAAQDGGVAPVLALSVPNASHIDVAAKLFAGRWDVTPTGLLDETHLRFFTEASLSALLACNGWYEVGRQDFRLEESDQHFPSDHPAVERGALLREHLELVRGQIDDFQLVNQFVRLYERGPLEAPVDFRAVDAPAITPFLSVVARTTGDSPQGLLATLTCLAAQSDIDFETVLVVHTEDEAIAADVQRIVELFRDALAHPVKVGVARGGQSQRLNTGLGHCTGRYIAFLDDDDFVTTDWVEAFRELAEKHPGQVVRQISVEQDVEHLPAGSLAPYKVTTPFRMRDDGVWSWPEHFLQNRTPICTFAVPRRVTDTLRLRFDESLEVSEDWDFFMRSVLVAGIATDTRITSLHHVWKGGSSRQVAPEAAWLTARDRIWDWLDSIPTLMPAGNAKHLRQLWLDHVELARVSALNGGLEAELAETKRERDLTNAAYEEIRSSEWWRASAPARRLLGKLKRGVRPGGDA
jgi:SAM-dependent methyltransferase/glycosyltransferase involved in cell wall biosynthesis